MAWQQLATLEKRHYMGRILVSLGLVGLIADLAFLAQPLERLVQRLGEGLSGIVPALGLSVLNAARAIALHQIDYFSLISRILVLFLALAAVVTGTVLWNSRRTAIDSGESLSRFASVRGDR
ncbi:MAG TPA: hypothetical protein VJW94_18580 [Candidatus Acidoferrum sp.]|nr:hypothetical protein [Candidatus Acidoferrum sp.]